MFDDVACKLIQTKTMTYKMLHVCIGMYVRVYIYIYIYTYTYATFCGVGGLHRPLVGKPKFWQIEHEVEDLQDMAYSGQGVSEQNLREFGV